MRSRRSKASGGAVLFLLILLLLVLLIIMRSEREERRPSLEPGSAVALDGDTFERPDGGRVRLLGIDTPETGEPYYKEATARLQELLAAGSLSYRHGRRRSDDYGRELAFVYSGGGLINRQLLLDGLARTYFFPEDLNNPALTDSLCEAQRRARVAKVGIWSLPPPSRCDHYFGNARSRRFHRPDCSSISRSDTTRLVRLLTRGEFLDSCYSPCRNCKP